MDAARSGIRSELAVNEQQKPILPGKGASDYERYLRTDDLLALQKPAERCCIPTS